MMPLAAQTGAYLPQGIDQTKIAQLVRSDPRIQRAIQQLQGMPQENLKEIVMQAMSMQGNERTDITPPSDPIWSDPPIQELGLPNVDIEGADAIRPTSALPPRQISLEELGLSDKGIEGVDIAPPSPHYWTKDAEGGESIEDVAKRFVGEGKTLEEFVKGQRIKNVARWDVTMDGKIASNNGGRIDVNAKEWDKLPPEEKTQVIHHEVGHDVYNSLNTDLVDKWESLARRYKDLHNILVEKTDFPDAEMFSYLYSMHKMGKASGKLFGKDIVVDGKIKEFMNNYAIDKTEQQLTDIYNKAKGKK